jgi:uncharacterized DUF497 family protein
MIDFENIIGFDWDDFNLHKNWNKHSVHWTECEEIFFNKPLVVNYDFLHSESENRYFVLGRTSLNRKLFLVFTLRNDKIRIISSRDMNKKEKIEYEKHTKIQ